MINLLPQENKEKIRHEYLRRLFVVATFFVVFSFFAGIVILLPYSYSLLGQKQSYEQQLKLSEKRLSERGAGAVEAFVEEINLQIAVLSKGHEGSCKTSRLIKKILSAKPFGVKIEGFDFSGGEIAVSGESQKRDDLIAFINFLESGGEFEKVNSPVSNLLKERDLDFSIKIEL